MRYLIKFIKTERTVVARRWKEEGMRSYCLMSIEFQFCKIIQFWRRVAKQCEYI